MFKEFFTSLCKEVFDTDRGLWLANVKNELYPNPRPNVSLFCRLCWFMWVKFQRRFSFPAHSLNWYRFIGRIPGKAMYEGILVDVAFAGFFLAKVCP